MDNSKDKQVVEYVITLYGPKDDTQRGDGPPKGKNPFHLFDYRESLGQFTKEQLERFLADGKFSPYRTKPLCICCPHIFVVESFQEVKKDSHDYQATLQYANLKEIKVHASNCKSKSAIVGEIEWLKGLAASIRGERPDDKPLNHTTINKGKSVPPPPQTTTHSGPATNYERDKLAYKLSFESTWTWGDIATEVNKAFPGEQLDADSAATAAKRYEKKNTPRRIQSQNARQGVSLKIKSERH